MASSSRSLQPSCRAFTLIELLVVIAIVTVLSGIVLAVGRSTTEAGRTARARAELGSLATALESYRRVFGDYPQTGNPDVLLQSLIGKRGPTGTVTNVRTLVELEQFTTLDEADPFTNPAALCIDPWGTPYRYAYKTSAPWAQTAFVLFSSGPDGMHAELLSGGRIDELAAANIDNVHANR